MNKLERILINAVQHSEYYKHRIPADKTIDINKFPVLTKEDLRNYCDDILVDKYKYGDASMLKSVFTSGSTGINTKVFWTNEDYIKSNISIWRLRMKWYGISPESKRIVFNSMVYNGRDLLKPPKTEKSLDGATISFSKFHLNDEDIKEYIDTILQFEPVWISVQTSTLIRIIDVLNKYQISFPTCIKYVELNGEVVTKSNMENFRQHIKVPIANLYGAMEVNSIAYECPHHSLHVLEDNVYLESVKCSDNSDMVIVTSLHNMAMPIVRYNLCDKITFSKSKSCACGCSSLIIETIDGRITDKIVLPNEKFISAYTFIYYIESTNLLLHNAIVQFKVIQKNYSDIEILLKINPEFTNWKNTISQEISKNISSDNQINDFKVLISFVDNFNETNNSKFKIFESLIK